jgi:hypothetical protein
VTLPRIVTCGDEMKPSRTVKPDERLDVAAVRPNVTLPLSIAVENGNAANTGTFVNQEARPVLSENRWG